MRKYELWDEAAKAAQILGIKSYSEYVGQHRSDPLLPDNPALFYGEDWHTNGGCPGFLGIKKGTSKLSYSEASILARKLGIRSSSVYDLKRRKCRELPSRPAKHYIDEWDANGGWDGFLRRRNRERYLTIAEASAAAVALGISTVKEYQKRSHEDSKLPSSPDQFYKRDWGKIGLWNGFLGKKIIEKYSDWESASYAVKKLKISTADEYRQNYAKDPRLPSKPSLTYCNEWNERGKWLGFLGRKNKEIYRSLGQASDAAIKLKIRSKSEYRRRYKEDNKLPLDPERIYADEWGGGYHFKDFLGVNSVEIYKTWEEASLAVQKIKISTSSEYPHKRKLDPRLPYRPDKQYSRDWVDNGRWIGFIRGKNLVPYETWDEASVVVNSNQVKSVQEYREVRKIDPRLPANPATKYKNVWKQKGGWFGFVGGVIESDLYDWLTASNAAIELGIESKAAYFRNYKKDKRLPSNPERVFSREWKERCAWDGFLKLENYRYRSWEEASTSARILGLKTAKEYRARYIADPRLPANPDLIYKNDWVLNGKWRGFLANKLSSKYESWEEASSVAVLAGFSTAAAYKAGFKTDPRLPYCPEVSYGACWKENGGWYGFLRTSHKKRYETWDRASKAAQELGIWTQTEYQRRYREDKKLPSTPFDCYPVEWEMNAGWDGFLRRGNTLKYSAWEDAAKSARSLKISTMKEYRSRYQCDRRLPANPSEYYVKDWQRNGAWKGFLFGEEGLPYKTYEEAADASFNLKIKSSVQYKKRYIEDRKLPHDPSKTYKEEWVERNKWRGFLGIDRRIFSTWIEASDRVQNMCIKSKEEYFRRYREDPGLRKNPAAFYRDEWTKNGGWDGFLLPRKIDSLEKAAHAARYLDVSTERAYAEKYKTYPFGTLPRHPERKSYSGKGKWPGWAEFLGVNFYNYNDLVSLVRDVKSITNQSSYNEYRRSTKNIRMPASPEEYYDEWKNWYQFLGKSEPYNVKFIRSENSLWADRIVEFLETARAAGHKENSLCKFQRDFIERLSFQKSPDEFLVSIGGADASQNEVKEIIETYKKFLESITSKKNTDSQYKVNQAVCEFFNWVIENYLSEDNDDGEVIPLVRNPLEFTNIGSRWPGWNKDRFETNKNILPYHYLKDGREWLIPIGASSFADLKHLYQQFGSDWYPVDQELLDKEDSDCVWEVRSHTKLGKQYYLWCPVTWVHTYALLHTPFRGRQLAYNDSGEADSDIPVLDSTGRIIWVKNIKKLAGLTDNQGFIRRYPDDEIGSYCTTNKTNNRGGGYAIPWMDRELAYWILKLRNWQMKYNAIDKPTAWTLLKRTNLNKSQLKQKGCNCFLFRAFSQVEAATFSGYLADRLAVALYNVQDRSVSLADVPDGKESTPSNYKSIYTPHSVRGSLITSFLSDFGLPPHIVMKIVGHANIVMTAYYNKPGSVRLREMMSAGEKRALKDKALSQMRLVHQGKIDQIANDLIGNSEDVLAVLSSSAPPSNFTFTDYGVCPFGGGRCHEGGAEIEHTKVYGAVPEGYMGKQNCVQCRFFITGPAFLGGMLSLANEIFLASKNQSILQDEIRENLDFCKNLLREKEIDAYDTQIEGGSINDLESLEVLELRKNKASAELERATKKLDMYLCDLNSVYRLINQCQAIMNEDLKGKKSGLSKIKLIKQKNFSINIEPIETTYFHQLNEVCANSVIYESADATQAILPRSQSLDRMAVLNKMDPMLFMLNEKQQLIVGNQMAELLITRLKTWSRVDDVVSGRIFLSDLGQNERIYPVELQMLVSQLEEKRNESTRKLVKPTEG